MAVAIVLRSLKFLTFPRKGDLISCPLKAFHVLCKEPKFCVSTKAQVGEGHLFGHNSNRTTSLALSPTQ